MRYGFRIGFDRSSPLGRPPPNFQSVMKNLSIMEKYITNELATGRLVASTPPHPSIHTNPIGIIPKLHQLGKYRLIVDLSAPHGSSVNDGISRSLCSLQYISFDQTARLVAACGKGALMAKTNLCSVYRQVPVHTNDRGLLGIELNGQTYIDRALPFGLWSAPKLFSAVADGLAWVLQCSGVSNCIYYLEGFLIWGPPASPICKEALTTTTTLCARLGLPSSSEKTVGPTTTLTFLSFEIDSISQQLRLPEEKLTCLRAH